MRPNGFFAETKKFRRILTNVLRLSNQKRKNYMGNDVFNISKNVTLNFFNTNFFMGSLINILRTFVSQTQKFIKPTIKIR